ncbi:MAG: restriction endonuclease subunit S [Plesiomonas sp.]|uniref:restriction endonuclease subunit S n=1 Tax=Plesiomonas sp. TaxID=2486279 RepID=UPI003F342123
MAGRYKAYQEYKDSGVEWLKEIPIHWDCKKLKFFLNDLVRGPFGSALKKEFFTTAGIKVYEQKNCIQDSVGLGDSYISEDTYRELSRFTVTNGDLLMSCSGTIGRIVEVTEPYEKGIINQALLIMRINEDAVNKAFFKHIFRSEDVQKQIKDNTQGGAMQNLVATDVFKSVSFTVPSYEEQQKIADFLDHETAKIDTLIAKQEKLIELLKEKRQAVISHAVTKGLNPDAPMKDSGVEWLGEVPEHWEVKRLKFSAELLSSKVADNNVRKVIALENIESGTGRYIETNSSYAEDGVTTEDGDVLFGKLRPYLSKVFLCNESSVAFGDLLAYRPKVGTLSQYLFYSMISGGFIEIVDSSTYGAKMPRASAEFINEMRIVLPPAREQEVIINQLNDVLSVFNRLTTKASDAIKLIQERKTALISAAVTGKIDVRDWELQGVQG